ncbi:MAG: SDR family oxidoreductase [Candidatus Marinimicrobia bacterium]|nr:SDR family oxidoreductase [Candidatus Neomarinimicrobiota bacterium]MCF7828651.1 SDR family oxidoreductase [Candidatus Neomarinimicrobiota bacterium]MCF7880392.1 SDR family oxidoreductase [Candidatus Neomarinimicrobiota bacterium]
MSKRLLITGISGFLGWNITRLKPKDWEIHGVYNTHHVSVPGVNTIQTDLTGAEVLNELFRKVQPEAVIHAAAVSSPNECENDPEGARRINIDASIAIAELCLESSIPLVFTSTDLVFDGESPPYAENTAPNPINIYGKHKAEAEQAIASQNPDALIVRLPLMFGDPGPASSNFYQYMRNQLEKGKSLTLFSDEHRTMLSGMAAARGIFQLLGKASGVVHLPGPESVSRYEFGRILAEVFGFPEELIEPVSQRSTDHVAARPGDVSLQSHRAHQLGFNPPPLSEQLRECRILESLTG